MEIFMTALNFLFDEKSLLLSMDTLSLRADDRIPYKYLTKFFPLPHMNCLICGTGNYQPVIDWFVYIQSNFIGNGILQLNLCAERNLKDFMQEHNGENLCTIYQFGFHETDRRLYGYAYRSINGFVSELIPYGTGLKPPDVFFNIHGELDLEEIFISAKEKHSIDTDRYYEEIFRTIMHKQKEFDERLPSNNRLGIGGIVQLIYMSRDSLVIKNLEYFDDFMSQYEIMLAGAGL